LRGSASDLNCCRIASAESKSTKHSNPAIPAPLWIWEAGAMWSLDGDDLLFGAALIFVITIVLAMM
jgi:hypothetical protein